ncbi:MAG: hypothetical protein ACRD6W_10335, partial [Nitrososphaerales archaeon]
RKLRIPVFVPDSDALIELKNAILTRRGYDARRVMLLGPSEFRLKVDERSFELFKVREEARLSGGMGGGLDLPSALRKYSISKLPVTERLLGESGLLVRVSAEYTKRFSLKVANGQGRSPKKLAEEALVEACERVVPVALSDLVIRKYHLKSSSMRSLIVKTELANWQG